MNNNNNNAERRLTEESFDISFHMASNKSKQGKKMKVGCRVSTIYPTI